MGSENDYYLSPEDAALQVVATAVKKKHLRTETLIVNSILGGIFLSVSGMLALGIQAGCKGILAENPMIVHMLQGLMFPFGLVFIVMNGVDLFNSNILFFTVATLHRKTSIWALLKSWTFSWIFNLGGCLIQVYIVNHLGGLTRTPDYIEASIDIVAEKVGDPNWGEIFMRGLASNFLVCLAIYLQVMSRPFVAKVLAITLPIFAFVASGYDHVVADMFLIPTGLVNGAPVSVGVYIYKSLIPVTLGNIVGGGIFSISVPWYLHIHVAQKYKR
ncbi:Formate/nitrite transporter, partial [Nadsonia fulvescens var. elongata DSM 6958]